MPSNYKVSSDIDTILKKSTKGEVATFLGVDTNASGVATNASNIATNTADIATNTTDIATNTADIATNTSDISTNTANISTNTANIATNTANIATNTSGVATNASNIATLEQELTRDLDVKDTITITADKTPDENAVLEMVDKSTALDKRGALEKVNGILYVGPSTDNSKRWKFQHEPAGVFDPEKLSINFPSGGGLRLGQGGSFLNHYSEGNFDPTLASGDGTIVQSVYQVRQANYVGIGDLVQINIRMEINNFDNAWKTSTKNWKITDLPYKSIGNHNVEIRPIHGWMDLGDVNITGALQSGNDYLWVEKFVNNGTTAGAGNNTARINANTFATHPFNFTSGSFAFIITGSYKTDEA